MKKLICPLFFPVWFCLLGFTNHLAAQNTRLNDENNVGWYAFFGTWKLNPKFDLHTEYQWRRDQTISTWQQSLLRLGVNYNHSPAVTFHLGYGWIETFRYGDYPTVPSGGIVPEHRLYQMVLLRNPAKPFSIVHRFMLEQRFVGRLSSQNVQEVNEWVYTNRFRYRIRLDLPLKGATLEDNELYAAAFNEILIGFGKNVNENVFDQNRLAFLLGYQFNPTFRLEAGYMNQILQQGGEVNNQSVFQNNHALLINLFANINLRKKPIEK